MTQRQIKFRAWDPITKQWLAEGFHLFGETTCFDIVQQKLTPNPDKPDQPSLMRLNDVIVTQFTGLLDKNGKEIYEGDVVEHGEIGAEIWEGDGTIELCPIGKVVYQIAGFNIVQIRYGKATVRGKLVERFGSEWSTLSLSRYDGEFLWGMDGITVKVIGNIYENPELLND